MQPGDSAFFAKGIYPVFGHLRSAKAGWRLSIVSTEHHCTVSCSVAECCTPPEVPVIATLNVLVVVRVKF